MTGNITWEMIIGFLTIGGAIAGIWRQVSGGISKVSTDLQEYKLHVAETFATKSGVDHQYQAVSKSITDVGERMEKRLDGMNERLDRVIEAGKHPTPSNSRRVS